MWATRRYINVDVLHVVLLKGNFALTTFVHCQHSLTDSQHANWSDRLRHLYWNRLKEVAKKKSRFCWLTRNRGAAPAARSFVTNAVDSWAGWHQHQPWRSDHMCVRVELWHHLLIKWRFPPKLWERSRDSGGARLAGGLGKRRFSLNDRLGIEELPRVFSQTN